MADASRIKCQVYMYRRTIYDKPCEEVYIMKTDNTCLVEEVYMFREEESRGSEDNEPLAEQAHIARILEVVKKPYLILTRTDQGVTIEIKGSQIGVYDVIE